MPSAFPYVPWKLAKFSSCSEQKHTQVLADSFLSPFGLAGCMYCMSGHLSSLKGLTMWTRWASGHPCGCGLKVYAYLAYMFVKTIRRIGISEEFGVAMKSENTAITSITFEISYVKLSNQCVYFAF